MIYILHLEYASREITSSWTLIILNTTENHNKIRCRRPKENNTSQISNKVHEGQLKKGYSHSFNLDSVEPCPDHQCLKGAEDLHHLPPGHGPALVLT